MLFAKSNRTFTILGLGFLVFGNNFKLLSILNAICLYFIDPKFPQLIINQLLFSINYPNNKHNKITLS